MSTQQKPFDSRDSIEHSASSVRALVSMAQGSLDSKVRTTQNAAGTLESNKTERLSVAYPVYPFSLFPQR